MTTKDNILSLLKLHKADFARCGVTTVGLFGSYLLNKQSASSDIDLLIDFEPGKATFDNLMSFHDIVEGIFKNEKVEVVTKNSLSPYIGPKILNEVQYA
ncbi:MAG TPA: nucleotidyltransferase family protein [Flavobacterium sp.]|nr:nucleotidyltransferase family protein [Flavobacterium sp.]